MILAHKKGSDSPIGLALSHDSLPCLTTLLNSSPVQTSEMTLPPILIGLIRNPSHRLRRSWATRMWFLSRLSRSRPPFRRRYVRFVSFFPSAFVCAIPTLHTVPSPRIPFFLFFPPQTHLYWARCCFLVHISPRGLPGLVDRNTTRVFSWAFEKVRFS